MQRKWGQLSILLLSLYTSFGSQDLPKLPNKADFLTVSFSGAARLVGEAYPFTRKTKLILTYDNHNSVNGLRVFARNKGTKTTYVQCKKAELRVDQRELNSVLGRRSGWNKLSGSRSRGGKGLFAYPAQSNFSGVRHPLSWVSMAQRHGYDVLLDAGK